MSKLLLGSIDLSKINKEDIITTDKNGQRFSSGAKYLKVAMWYDETEPDQYGNHLAIKAGPKGQDYYIGNAKIYQPVKNNANNIQTPIADEESDDLPF